MLPILKLQDDLKKKIGKEKRDYPKPERDESLKKEIRTAIWPEFKSAFAIREKLERYEAIKEIKKSLDEK
jgi:polyribonucleotide nucleotidyltransferase